MYYPTCEPKKIPLVKFNKLTTEQCTYTSKCIKLKLFGCDVMQNKIKDVLNTSNCSQNKVNKDISNLV